MHIERIEYSDQKNAFLYFTKEGQSYQVSYETYMALKRHAPFDASEEETAIILEEDQKMRALARALTFASYMPRTTAEVRRRLEREQISQAAIALAIEKLNKMALLDDATYAVRYAEEKHRLKAWSKRQIQDALYQKGVAPDLIQAALAPIGDQAEEENLQRLLEKKYRSRNLADPKDYQRTFQALLRRGFSPSLVKKVLEKKRRAEKESQRADDLTWMDEEDELEEGEDFHV